MAFYEGNSFNHSLEKTLKGYHLVSDEPIKEAVWESILASALKRSDKNITWNSGSHESGKDIVVHVQDGEDAAISCKSCKWTKPQKDSLLISSYRMTKCNTVEEFVHEIDTVRCNFQYYGVLYRIEKKGTLLYSVYFIPSNAIKAEHLQWSETKSKKGWTTSVVNGVHMSVSKSMSNQLWIKLSKSMFEQYCVLKDFEIKRNKKVDYASLFDMFDTLSLVKPPSVS
jgi:hypothetical protein